MCFHLLLDLMLLFPMILPISVYYLGRDILGRRSLVVRQDEDGLYLSRVCDGSISKDWKEIEVDGLYFLDLSLGGATLRESTDGQYGGLMSQCVPWARDKDDACATLMMVRRPCLVTTSPY